VVVRGSPSALACSSSEIRPTRRSATSNSLILIDCLALACAMGAGCCCRNPPSVCVRLVPGTPNALVARFTGFCMVLVLLKVAPRYTGRSQPRAAMGLEFEGRRYLFSTQASFLFHLCTFRQAGHRMGTETSPRESNNMVSVLSPVGTAFPEIGQRIMIFGITRYCSP